MSEKREARRYWHAMGASCVRGARGGRLCIGCWWRFLSGADRRRRKAQVEWFRANSYRIPVVRRPRRSEDEA